jgi:hypothetical protein
VTSISLEIATGQYDSTRALFDGSVRIEGAEVTMRTGRTLPEIFERMMRHREFDVCELGWTFYLRGFGPDTPYLALPVFPNRMDDQPRRMCRQCNIRWSRPLGQSPRTPCFLALPYGSRSVPTVPQRGNCSKKDPSRPMLFNAVICSMTKESQCNLPSINYSGLRVTVHGS